MNGAYICIEKANKELFGIYCCKDCDLTTMGAILLDSYSVREKAEQLIALCDLISLAPNITDCKPYRYAKIKRPIYIQDMIADPWIHNIYLYTLYGEWLYICRDGGFKAVKTALDNKFNEVGIVRPTGFYGALNRATIDTLRSS